MPLKAYALFFGYERNKKDSTIRFESLAGTCLYCFGNIVTGRHG